MEHVEQLLTAWNPHLEPDTIQVHVEKLRTPRSVAEGERVSENEPYVEPRGTAR